MELFTLKDIEVEKNGNSLFSFKELNINKGDKVAIIGLSGSGKSTLLRLFNGMEIPKKGEILYKKNPIPNDKKLSLLRKNVILIDQSPFITGPFVKNFFYYIKNFSVYKNIKINEEEILQMLKMFSLSYISLDRKVDTLSISEKQRLALIRAILLKPEILLLDEPTSSLDKKITEIVIENILKKNIVETIISVSHNILWIKNCNKEIELCKKTITIKENYAKYN